jgi:hypothetical protein
LGPDEGEGGGWRSFGRCVLRGNDEELDLLRNKIEEMVREVRWAEAKRVEARREALAHRRCRI